MSGDRLAELGRKLDDLWTLERIAVALMEGRKDFVADEVVEAASRATGEVIEEIARTPAHDLAGLRIKAHAVTWAFGDNVATSVVPAGALPYEQVAFSIVDDLLRLA